MTDAITLIVSGLVIFVLIVTVMVLHEGRGDAKADAAKAWGVVSETKDQLELANAQVRVLAAERDSQRQRADWLLAQVYELRNDMVKVGARPHSECFEAWADRQEPCEQCKPLLGVRNG